MKHLTLAAACVTLLAAPAWGQWSDNFQAYTAGTEIIGQGGWAGWNDTAYPTAVVADDPGTPGVSDNVLKLVTSNNVLRPFGTGDYTSGRWVFTTMVYIPSAAHTNSSTTNTANLYLMNNYVSGGAKGYGAQLNFNLGTAATTSDTVTDAANGGTIKIVFDQWVEIRVEVNLDSNYRTTYYNGALLGFGAWYNPSDANQANTIAAVDLPVNSATNLVVYYDDMSIAAATGPACPSQDFEDFQIYALESLICGQCRWAGWGGATFSAVVTNDPAGTAGNQVLKAFANDDIVQEYSGYTSGAWVYTAKQYIPSTQHGAGVTTFILMNKYGAGSSSSRGWAVSLNFDLNDDIVKDSEAGTGGIPIVYDKWMTIRVEIDLDANVRSTYYVDPTPETGFTKWIGTSYWYDEFSTSHAKSIAAVDLWADAGGNPVYYDDIRIEAGTPLVLPPGTDLTTTARGSTASRYLVNLGQLSTGSNPPTYVGPNGSTIRPHAWGPQGLYEISPSGGNRNDPAGNWNYWNKLNDGKYGTGGDLVTFGVPGDDYVGYKFKLPATVTSIEYWLRNYGDGGPFNETPEVQYLDTMNGTNWLTIPAENLVWDHPYDAALAGRARRYVITINNPPTAIWGLRLFGHGAGAGDGDGFVGVTELTLYGNLEVGALNTSVNLARVPDTGAVAIAFPANGTAFGNLIDGNLTTAFNTFKATNWDASAVPPQTNYYGTEDYLGVTWTTPQTNVAALGVVFASYRDGGYFGFFGGGATCAPAGAPFRIEYTTDPNVAADARAVTWTPVTNLDYGRYLQDWRPLRLISPWTWQCSTGFLFRFDPIPAGITGIRIIGRAGKVSADGDGFVGAYELEVFGNQ